MKILIILRLKKISVLIVNNQQKIGALNVKNNGIAAGNKQKKKFLVNLNFKINYCYIFRKCQVTNWDEHKIICQ